MKKAVLFSLFLAALLFGAASSAAGLEIEGTFSLGNFGFTPARASTDATYPGTDYFWGGVVAIRQDISGSLQVESELRRDLIMGNTVSAMLQYKSEYFRAGMGPYLGLLNSSGTTLKSGISTLLGAEIPGIAFLTLRTDSSLGGQASAGGDYFAQSNEIRLGFYVRDSAICAIGLSYQQFASTPGATELIDSLTRYFFDAKVFEKNVPYRLDLTFAYQVLQRQYVGGPTHSLGSAILGAGIDLMFSPVFALILDFRTSVWTLGADTLAGLSDIGFSPFLFQASAGFRVTLNDAVAPADRQ